MWPETKYWPGNEYIRQVPPELEDEIIEMAKETSPNERWADIERTILTVVGKV